MYLIASSGPFHYYKLKRLGWQVIYRPLLPLFSLELVHWYRLGEKNMICVPPCVLTTLFVIFKHTIVSHCYLSMFGITENNTVYCL